MIPIAKAENNIVQFQGKLKSCTEGQKALLSLISKKVKSGESITMNEIVEMYQKNGQKTKQCKIWRIDEGMTYVDYASWELDNKARMWVLYNIGSLVKKGYLAVIPRINFS